MTSNFPRCSKCDRPIHPIMMKVGQSKQVKDKDKDGNEIIMLLCPLCLESHSKDK